MNRRLAIALLALFALVAACERIVELSPGSGNLGVDASESFPDAPDDAAVDGPDVDAPPADGPDVDAA